MKLIRIFRCPFPRNGLANAFVRHKSESTSKIVRIEPILVVHGGVGSDLTALTPNKIQEVKKAAILGYKVMMVTGSAVDGVEEAMNYMEESPEFNIGVGSMLNDRNEIEMDASIMDGQGLKVGAVGCVKNILHPTTLARGVMEFNPHVLVCDETIKPIAKETKLPHLGDNRLITDVAKELLKTPSLDTGNPGVIAIDKEGRVAAATGNAGKPRKPAGSLTEAAKIGCGIYADNRIGAVAVAGESQCLLRSLLAFEVYKSMLCGMNARTALKENLDCLKTRFLCNGGGIVLSTTGDVAVDCTTPQMAWAFLRGDNIHFGLNKGETFVEKHRL